MIAVTLFSLLLAQAAAQKSEEPIDIVIVSAQPRPTKEQMLSNTERLKVLEDDGYRVTRQNTLSIAIDERLVQTPAMTGFATFRKYLPTGTESTVIAFDALSRQERQALAPTILANPFQDTAQKVLSTKGGKMMITPTVIATLRCGGRTIKVTPMPSTSALPVSIDASMPIKDLEAQSEDNQTDRAAPVGMTIEIAGPTMPTSYRASLYQRAVAAWSDACSALHDEEFGRAEKQLGDALNSRSKAPKPGFYADLPQDYRNLIGDAVSHAYYNYGFSSSAEAMGALESGQLVELKYTAFMRFVFTQPNEPGFDQGFFLHNFRL